jgi:hypothetical protein
MKTCPSLSHVIRAGGLAKYGHLSDTDADVG